MLHTKFPGFTPRFIKKSQAVQIVESRRIVERMICATNKGGDWLLIVPPRPGAQRRDNLIDLESVYKACDRLLACEHPSLFPSEERKKNWKLNGTFF